MRICYNVFWVTVKMLKKKMATGEHLAYQRVFHH